MEDFSGGRPLIYKSGKMYERRQRILREVRKLIDERGVADFSVSEICTRAGVAQKTLYNAFGSKDNAIALAGRESLAETLEQFSFHYDQATIEGILERIQVINGPVLVRPAYTRALMSVYYSQAASRTVRAQIRDMVEAMFGAYLDWLVEHKAFRPGVTRASTLYFLNAEQTSVLSDWCLGDLTDDRLLERLCETALVVLAGCSAGEQKARATDWLGELRQGGPEWQRIRAIAEAPRPGQPN